MPDFLASHRPDRKVRNLNLLENLNGQGWGEATRRRHGGLADELLDSQSERAGS